MADIIKETFEIPPSTNIIDVLGSSGYTLETALADIVDNSISAGADSISISFDVNDLGNARVIIADNGTGMSLDDLKNAAIIANVSKNAKRDEFDLGRYSLGLKSASMSFCNKLYVISKREGNDPNSICIDFAYILRENKWSASVVEKPEYENKLKDSGTIVLWEDLKFVDADTFSRKQLNQKLFSIETHLSHTFSDYIMNKNLKIKMEKDMIEAWDPFMLHLDSVKCLDVDPISYKGSKIEIKPYILPVYSSLPAKEQLRMKGRGMSEQQGFYIYRNGRLINEGGWLNLPGMTVDNKSQYARIRVDIASHLDDDFKVNFMKNSLEIPDRLKSSFLDVAKLARKESLNSYAYKKNPTLKRKRKNKDNIPVWNVHTSDNSISLNINTDHPIIKELTKNMSLKEQKKLFSLLSKNLPVARIQSGIVKDKEYRNSEMMELIDETYNELKNSGMNDNDIKKKMISIEPFSLEKYRFLLLEYFIKGDEK